MKLTTSPSASLLLATLALSSSSSSLAAPTEASESSLVASQSFSDAQPAETPFMMRDIGFESRDLQTRDLGAILAPITGLLGGLPVVGDLVKSLCASNSALSPAFGLIQKLIGLDLCASLQSANAASILSVAPTPVKALTDKDMQQLDTAVKQIAYAVGQGAQDAAAVAHQETPLSFTARDFDDDTTSGDNDGVFAAPSPPPTPVAPHNTPVFSSHTAAPANATVADFPIAPPVGLPVAPPSMPALPVSPPVAPPTVPKLPVSPPAAPPSTPKRALPVSPPVSPPVAPPSAPAPPSASKPAPPASPPAAPPFAPKPPLPVSPPVAPLSAPEPPVAPPSAPKPPVSPPVAPPSAPQPTPPVAPPSAPKPAPPSAPKPGSSSDDASSSAKDPAERRSALPIPPPMVRTKASMGWTHRRAPHSSVLERAPPLFERLPVANRPDFEPSESK